jgi:hypothetical protein
MGTIGIHKDKDITVCLLDAAANGCTFATTVVEHHARAAGDSNLACAVGAMPVYHQKFICILVGGCQNRQKIGCLIAGRHDHRYREIGGVGFLR